MLKLFSYPNMRIDDSSYIVIKKDLNSMELDLLFYLCNSQYVHDTKESLIEEFKDDLEKLASMRNMTLEDYFEDLISRFPYHEY